MKNETLKTLLPIVGGLSFGDGLARFVEHNSYGLIEAAIGLVIICYAFYTIFRK